MKAIVKGIFLMSADVLLEDYCPDDPKCFGLWIDLNIGPDNEEGAHNYQVLVCTPDWIKGECYGQKAVWGRHRLIVCEYDLELIKEQIRHYVENCSGKDFWEMAQKVARIAAWEFEDYQP